RVLRQDPVLGVDERALRAAEAFLSGGPALRAESVRAEAAEDGVALRLVMHEAAGLGIEEDRVAEVVAEEAQIVVPEDANVAGAPGEVLDVYLAHQQRLVEIDRVGAAQPQPERGVFHHHVGNQRVAPVTDLLLPRPVLYPGELAVGPDAHPARMAVGLILAADVRPVEID